MLNCPALGFNIITILQTRMSHKYITFSPISHSLFCLLHTTEINSQCMQNFSEC